MNSEIKVFAPASVANVACGFDVLGFAIEGAGDEIIVRSSNTAGLKIKKISGTSSKLPLEVEKNTAGFAAKRLLEHLGEEQLGLEFEIIKKMPTGSGLGSSAASAVAGVMAVNEFLNRPLSKKELLPFAIMGEQIASGSYHGDNVAPSLMGGFQLVIGDRNPDVHSLPVPKNLYAVVIYPEIEVLTKEARGMLKDTVKLKQSIVQNANMAGLIVGLFRSDFDLIKHSLKDVIIEPQRAKLIPKFHQVQNTALEAGALGCSISGAGPSIFALCNSRLTAEKVGVSMSKIFFNANIKAQLFTSPINQTGATKCEDHEVI